MTTSPHELRHAVHAALDKADDYYARVAEIQAALHERVQGLLGEVHDPRSRAFLTTFLRFDAEFSAVQDGLSSLHAELGRTRRRLPQPDPETVTR